jgi:hypothetical protein
MPDWQAPGSRARRTSALKAVACLGAALFSAPAHSGPDAGKPMSSEKWAANETVFSSRREAEEFLSRTLPLATAGNPRYISKADKAETVWLTKSIAFSDGAAGRGIQVSTDEEYTEVRAGVSTPGKHQAVFSLGDVGVSVETSETDVTEAREPALGIIFRCSTPKCIRAKWNGQESASDWTDIYLQDATLRGRILAAFEFLETGGR